MHNLHSGSLLPPFLFWPPHDWHMPTNVPVTPESLDSSAFSTDVDISAAGQHRAQRLPDIMWCCWVAAVFSWQSLVLKLTPFPAVLLPIQVTHWVGGSWCHLVPFSFLKCGFLAPLDVIQIVWQHWRLLFPLVTKRWGQVEVVTVPMSPCDTVPHTHLILLAGLSTHLNLGPPSLSCIVYKNWCWSLGGESVSVCSYSYYFRQWEKLRGIYATYVNGDTSQENRNTNIPFPVP